jgi:predicted RNA-binding Zn-ribbon protein involved in translation (DUF1610 family)
LIFTCTTQGGTRTDWRGTAFDCPNIGNQIILRHNNFNSSESVQCSAGSIVGRPLNAIGDCYTSQLIVTVVAGLNNKTVQCTHTSDTAVSALIGSVTILTPSGIGNNVYL